MKRLIVNADDFGFTRGVNAGIERAFQSGILTSATIMAAGNAFENAVDVARANPGLAIGCHLTLVGGLALSDPRRIPTLAGETGLLPRTLSELSIKLARRAIRSIDIETELRSQIERVMAAGITPSHLDTHKHAHINPLVMGALGRVAADYGITRVRNPFESFSTWGLMQAIRSGKRTYVKQSVTSLCVLPASVIFRRLAGSSGLRAPNRFFGMALTGLLDSRGLTGFVSTIREGSTELMCHPGIYDDELEASPTRLKRQRQQELEALIDPLVKESLSEFRIKLINYRELA